MIRGGQFVVHWASSTNVRSFLTWFVRDKTLQVAKTIPKFRDFLHSFLPIVSLRAFYLVSLKKAFVWSQSIAVSLFPRSTNSRNVWNSKKSLADSLWALIANVLTRNRCHHLEPQAQWWKQTNDNVHWTMNQPSTPSEAFFFFRLLGRPWHVHLFSLDEAFDLTLRNETTRLTLYRP